MVASLNPEIKDNENSTEVQGVNDFYTEQKNKRKRTIAMVFLGAMAILIVVFMLIQTRDILEIPFPNGLKFSELIKQASRPETEIILPLKDQDPDKLKAQDTDGDGLNDFDELNIYLTSPYLADSDSDGVNDFDEIKAQEDPNCPMGQNCFRTEELYAEEQERIAAKEEQLNLTADQLRALLKETGEFTDDQISLFSDAELLAFYEDFLAANPDLKKEMGVQDTVTVEKTPAEVLLEAQNATPDEIRSILRKQGVDAATLEAIDDETLKQMYLEAYDKAKEKLSE